MDWSLKVERFEEIRREYEFGEGTIVGVARKLKVHRRMVRQAVRSATPPPRKKTIPSHSKLKPAIPFIDEILEQDRKALKRSIASQWELLQGGRTDLRAWVSRQLAEIERQETVARFQTA